MQAVEQSTRLANVLPPTVWHICISRQALFSLSLSLFLPWARFSLASRRNWAKASSCLRLEQKSACDRFQCQSKPFVELLAWPAKSCFAAKWR